MQQTPDTDKTFCRIVADIMAAHGVEDVVCSPGSRNVPILAAADAHPGLHTHIVIDERAAAFMALGISLVSQKPVALVCTSGTAMLNYLPAVAEAFHQGLPLIVVTADRPVQWIGQDDSQTIVQPGAMGTLVKASYDIPDLDTPDSEMLWYVNRVANDAMLRALQPQRGPVHINLQLAAPLGGPADSQLPPQRVVEMTQPDGALSRRQTDMLADEAAGCRILVVAGFMQPDSRLNRAVAAMGRLPNVALMCETLSNLHLHREAFMTESLLSGIDRETGERLRPDLVITLGGALVSAKTKHWLRSCPPKEHWAVGHRHATVDTFKCLTRRIEANPAAVLGQLAGALARRRCMLPSGYGQEWAEGCRQAARSAAAFMASAPWSGLKAAQMLLTAMPRECNLFLSNGTSVRYGQALDYPLPHASYGNRGVSGIDGTTSTAVGCAMAYNGPTLLLSGDMSLCYDLSGLALPQVPPSMRIAVVDDGGGGIFRFINAGLSPEMRERMLCAAPGIDIDAVAAALGWRVLTAGSEDELRRALPAFFAPGYGKSLLRLTVTPRQSADTMRAYLTRTHTS